MPNKFKTSEFFQDDIIPKIIESLKELSATYEKEIDKIKKKAIELSGVNESVNVTTAEGREQTAKTAKATDDLARAYKRQQQALSDNKQKIEEIKLATRTLNSVKKNEARLNASASGSYNKLAAQYNLIKIRLNAMSGAQRKSTLEGKRLEKQARVLFTEMKKLQSATGKNVLNVGNYGSAFKRLGASIKTAAAAYLGFAAARRIFSDIFSTLAGFEKQMSAVRAISNATDNEFKLLREDAKTLGATTTFTAKQVAELQTEFAKLGFSTKEILGATKATIQLAQATGEGLAESAEAAGATVRAFGLDASETNRVVDVMARSFTSSALNLERFREGAKLVSPIAKNANVSLEEMTAHMSVLADAGLHGSLAGTALRKAYIEFAKSGKPIIETVKELSDKNISLSEATDLVGVRAANALLILTKNQEKISKLTKSYKNAGGAAKEMADIQLDNLSGSITLLKSAWDGLVIAFSGANKVFRDVVDSMTGLINNVRDFISPSSALKREFEDLTGKVSALDDELPSLLNRYEELTKKTKPTKDEQEELGKLIARIGEVTPTAITEVDKYGNVLSISAEKSREFLKAEKARLKFVNQESINSIEKEIAAINEKVLARQREIKAGGTFRATRQGQQFLPFSSDEIRNARIELQTFQDQILGADTELKRLSGKNISKEGDSYLDGLFKSAKTNVDGVINQLFILSEEANLAEEEKRKRERERKARAQRLIKQLEVERRIFLSRMKLNADFDESNILAKRKFNVEYFLAEQDLSNTIIEEKRRLNLITQSEFEAALLDQQVKLKDFKNKTKKELIDIFGEIQSLPLFDFGKAAEDGVLKRVKEIAAKAAKTAKDTLKGERKFSILSMLGLEGEKEKEALNTALDSAKQSLSNYVAAIEKAADAKVAASDRAVSAAENEYNRQVELQAAGLANNAQTANQELQQAREIQQKALEDKRKAQKQQVILDTVAQASNIITAVSDVLKTEASLPLKILGAGLIIGTFLAAKAKAIAATKQEFAEGDLTVLNGGSHSSGNDVFIGEQKGKKQYAEGGEARMILSKRATQKYMSNGMLPAIFQGLKSGNFERQFIRMNEAGQKMQQNIGIVGGSGTDTRRMESLLRKLVEQNQETEYTNGNLTVRKFRNWTSRTRTVN